MSSRSVRRLAVIAVAAAALFAACGDDDTTGEPATGAPATTSGESAPATDAVDPTTTAPAPSGRAGAAVAIGGEEYALEQQVVCVAMGGAIGAQFRNADGTLTFHVDLPPPGWESSGDGWEPPSVRFDDEREDAYLQWEAGGEVLAGMTGVPDGVAVTEYSIDGRAASGSATVVDLTSVMVGEPATAELTFEVACT